MGSKRAIIAAVSIAAGMLDAPWARAQSVAQYYGGRTITLYVGTAAGGLYDAAGRIIGRHMGRFIPGEPKFVIDNLPGGEGIVLANRLANTIERTGAAFGLVDRSVVQTAAQGGSQALYNPATLTWIGSLSSYANDAFFLAVNANFRAKNIADLRRQDVSAQIGATSGTTNFIFAMLARNMLGLHLNVVRGYANSPAIYLAQSRGEIDGHVTSLTSIRVQQRDLWEERKIRPIVQFARTTRLAELGDVPTARELISDEMDRAVLQFSELPFQMALPFVGPPDIPPDRAAALQSAFLATVKDPQFLEDAAKLHLDVSPIDSPTLRGLVLQTLATPKNVIDRYSETLK